MCCVLVLWCGTLPIDVTVAWVVEYSGLMSRLCDRVFCMYMYIYIYTHIGRHSVLLTGRRVRVLLYPKRSGDTG